MGHQEKAAELTPQQVFARMLEAMEAHPEDVTDDEWAYVYWPRTDQAA